ncbi:MAG: hypothetical protein APR53_04185 [Methanoculleus sp. SDB]|nr:MAG: hypothetical protein APR53_04185 [Methanoculleus sp. SDB]
MWPVETIGVTLRLCIPGIAGEIDGVSCNAVGTPPDEELLENGVIQAAAVTSAMMSAMMAIMHFVLKKI